MMRAMKVLPGLIGVLAAAGGAWLLLGDARAGGGPGGGQPPPARHATAQPQAAHKAKRVRAVARSGYCGYGGCSNLPCAPHDLNPFATDGLSRKGDVLCYASDGNPVGDNADFGTDIFYSTKDGPLVNVTKDGKHCSGGSKQGQSCQFDDQCPGGFCFSGSGGPCAGSDSGRTLFFVYSGNPKGDNPDLGDELFSYDTKKQVLTQLTKQASWCSNDVSRACTTDADCIITNPDNSKDVGGCDSARIGGLQVSSSGRTAQFTSDGDPVGGNGGHANAAFLVVTGKHAGMKLLGTAGRLCGPTTQNVGAACTKTSDCGTICGDGKKEGAEECESGGYGASACTAGSDGNPRYCGTPGSSTQCKCVTPVCGNGLREPGEQCDGADSSPCGPAGTCTPQCTCAAS